MNQCEKGPLSPLSLEKRKPRVQVLPEVRETG